MLMLLCDLHVKSKDFGFIPKWVVCGVCISSGGVVFIANNLVIILVTKVFFIKLFS